jgi:hypothetical protein
MRTINDMIWKKRQNMSTRKRTRRPVKLKSILRTPATTLAEDMEDIRSMTDEEIDQELANYGIDVQQAIHTVKSMVRTKMHDWEKRGLLHPEQVTHSSTSVHTATGEE